jgi:Arc/MetJ-type ribon-helix-helix transcriptional regulator
LDPSWTLQIGCEQTNGGPGNPGTVCTRPARSVGASGAIKLLDTCFLLLLPLKVMEVDLTADQRELIRQAIETGRFHRAEDAVREALLLWEERERGRAEILAAVDIAEASLSRGEGRAVTQQSMRELANEVKQRGRLRLDAEQQTPR